MSAFAKFDPRSLILERLRNLRISIAQAASLQPSYRTNLPRWIIERILNGSRPASEAELDLLRQLCTELEDLARSFPVALDWSASHDLRNLLEKRHEQSEREAFLEKRRTLESEIEAIEPY